MANCEKLTKDPKLVSKSEQKIESLRLQCSVLEEYLKTGDFESSRALADSLSLPSNEDNNAKYIFDQVQNDDETGRVEYVTESLKELRKDLDDCTQKLAELKNLDGESLIKERQDILDQINQRTEALNTSENELENLKTEAESLSKKAESQRKNAADAARKTLLQDIRNHAQDSESPQLRPQWEDAEKAVLDELLQSVQKDYFDDEGNLKSDLKSEQKEDVKFLSDEWKNEFSTGFADAEAKELLRNELIQENHDRKNSSAPTTQSLRLLEVIRENKDALVTFLAASEDERKNIIQKNGILSILVKDDNFHRLLAAGDVHETTHNAEWYRQKLSALLKEPPPVLDNRCVKTINLQLHAFVRSQLACIQDEFNALVDDCLKQRVGKATKGFEFSQVRLAAEGTERKSAYRPTTSDLKKAVEGLPTRIGYDQFATLVLKRYFNEIPLENKLKLASSLHRSSSADASPGERLGALLKGAGPLMLKMLQALDPEKNAVLSTALQDMKSNLIPIPPEILKAHLADIVTHSGGRIDTITVRKTLGCASVGQTLLCHLEGTGFPLGGQDVVVKILRPDALASLRRERDFMLRCAKEAGMENVYEAIIEKTLEEFDLTLEEKNIDAGKVYNGKCEGIQTLTKIPLVNPMPGTLILGLAPGSTLEGLLRTGDDLKKDLTEKFKFTFTIKFGGRGNTYDSVKESIRKEKGETSNQLPYVHKDVRMDYLANIRKNLEKMRIAQEKLANLTKMWINESIFESGVYHGDLHAGNLMFDDTKGLTVIDFGNVSKLEQRDRTNFVALIRYCSEVDGAQGYLDAQSHFEDKMPPEWIQRTLSPLADKFYKELKEMLSSDDARKLTSIYEQGEEGIEKDGETFVDGGVRCFGLKHELMAILSSGSGTPDSPADPFGRLSVILKRLEARGISTPRPIAAFLTSALRLKNAVNDLGAEYENLCNGLKQMMRFNSHATPKIFSILCRCVSEYDDKEHVFRRPVSPTKAEIDQHKKSLAVHIKASLSDPEKLKRLKADVEWLKDDKINGLLKRLVDENGNTEENRQALADAICQLEQNLYKEHDDELFEPKSLKTYGGLCAYDAEYTSFASHFNSAINEHEKVRIAA